MDEELGIRSEEMRACTKAAKLKCSLFATFSRCIGFHLVSVDATERERRRQRSLSSPVFLGPCRGSVDSTGDHQTRRAPDRMGCTRTRNDVLPPTCPTRRHGPTSRTKSRMQAGPDPRRCAGKIGIQLTTVPKKHTALDMSIQDFAGLSPRYPSRRCWHTYPIIASLQHEPTCEFCSSVE